MGELPAVPFTASELARATIVMKGTRGLEEDLNIPFSTLWEGNTLAWPSQEYAIRIAFGGMFNRSLFYIHLDEVIEIMNKMGACHSFHITVHHSCFDFVTPLLGRFLRIPFTLHGFDERIHSFIPNYDESGTFSGFQSGLVIAPDPTLETHRFTDDIAAFGWNRDIDQIRRSLAVLLRQQANFINIHDIFLSPIFVTDDVLQALAGLPHLQTLCLVWDSTSIGAEMDVPRLATQAIIPGLKTLLVEVPSIREVADIIWACAPEGLQHLEVIFREVSKDKKECDLLDQAVRHLPSLKLLAIKILSNTTRSFNIAALKNLPESLETLIIDQPPILELTNAKFRRLHQSLPNLKTLWLSPRPTSYPEGLCDIDTLTPTCFKTLPPQLTHLGIEVDFTEHDEEEGVELVLPTLKANESVQRLLCRRNGGTQECRARYLKAIFTKADSWDPVWGKISRDAMAKRGWEAEEEECQRFNIYPQK